MKILILTKDGLALGLAQRLAMEGNSVDVYPEDISLSSTGNSLYTISHNLWKSIQECKFIIADSGGWEKVYIRAKMYNKPIIGCNEFADLLNSDSVKEYEICAKLSISCPKSEIYNDTAGLQPVLLSGESKRYYIRHKRRIFTCTKPEWLAWSMYQLPAETSVLLQEEVTGYHMTVVGWFNGLDWVKPFFYFTPEGKGINACVALAQKRSTRLTINTIEPLSGWLKAIDYRGPVSVNLIVTKDKEYVDNIYVGFTAPCVFAMIEGLKDMPLSNFFNILAFGMQDEVSVSLDYLMAIGVTKSDVDMHGAPILGVNSGNLSHIFFHGAYKDDDKYYVSDEIETVYTAVSRGRDLEETARRVYRTISSVEFPTMKYVTNLRERASVTFNYLKTWGII